MAIAKGGLTEKSKKARAALIAKQKADKAERKAKKSRAAREKAVRKAERSPEFQKQVKESGLTSEQLAKSKEAFVSGMDITVAEQSPKGFTTTQTVYDPYGGISVETTKRTGRQSKRTLGTEIPTQAPTVTTRGKQVPTTLSPMGKVSQISKAPLATTVPDIASRVGQTTTRPTERATQRFITERVRADIKPAVGPQPQIGRDLSQVKQTATQILQEKTTVLNLDRQIQALETAKRLEGVTAGEVKTDIRTPRAALLAQKEREIKRLMQKEDIKTAGVIGAAAVTGGVLGGIAVAAPAAGSAFQVVGLATAPVFVGTQISEFQKEIKAGAKFAATQRAFRIGGAAVAGAAGFKVGQVRATKLLGKEEFLVTQAREPSIVEKEGVKKLVVKETRFIQKGKKPELAKDLDVEFKGITKKGDVTAFTKGKGKLKLDEKTFDITESKGVDPFGTKELLPTKSSYRVLSKKQVKQIKIAKSKDVEVTKDFEFTKVKVLKETTREIKLKGADTDKVSILKGKFVETKKQPKDFKGVELAFKTEKGAAAFGKDPSKEFFIIEKRDEAIKSIASDLIAKAGKTRVIKTTPSGTVLTTQTKTVVREFAPITGVKALPVKTTRGVFVTPSVKAKEEVKTKFGTGVKQEPFQTQSPSQGFKSEDKFKTIASSEITQRRATKFSPLSGVTAAPKSRTDVGTYQVESYKPQKDRVPSRRVQAVQAKPAGFGLPKVKLPEFGGARTKIKKSKLDVEQDFGYTPTVFAGVLKIKGKGKARGGLGLRPLKNG